jgi:cytochrome c oxidase assembly factor CtaG/putative copper export protein
MARAAPAPGEPAVRTGTGPGTQPPAAGERRTPGLALLVASAAAWAVAALVAALLFGGGRPRPAAPGLPDAGAFTGWALPVARLLLDVTAVGTVGVLLTGAVLAPSRGGQLSPAAFRILRGATWWGLAWAGAAVATLLLSLSEIVGVPVGEVLSPDVLGSYGASVQQGRALLAVVAIAVVVSAYARWTLTRGGAVLLLVLAVAGLLPTLFTGHSADAANHDLATTSLLTHVVAATLWVGGLLGLVTAVGAAGPVLAVAVPRFSRLALVCFAVVGFSGLYNAANRLGLDAGAWTSSYGVLVLAKAAALAVLGFLGFRHRQRTVPAVVAGRPRAFLSLAGVEVAVMAATVGLAVALSRTPTPPTAAAASGPGGEAAAGAVAGDHASVHPVLGADVPAFSLGRLLSEWRVDALVVTVVALALAGYLLGVRRLAARGERWSPWRTSATVAGLGVAGFALCGGLATYSTVLFSVNLAQYLTLALLVPLLLALGAPITLAMRVRGTDPAWPGGRAGRALEILTDPVNGLIVFLAVLYGVYGTGLFEASLRYFAVHLLVAAAALAAGCLVLWPLLGVDPVPRPRPRADRTIVLVALLVLVAAYGVLVASRDVVLGGTWFPDLALPWVDPSVDQRRGAGIALVAVQVVGPLALGALWAQSRLAGGAPVR